MGSGGVHLGAVAMTNGIGAATQLLPGARKTMIFSSVGGSRLSVKDRIGIQARPRMGWLAGLAKLGYGQVSFSLFFFCFVFFSIFCFQYYISNWNSNLISNLFCRS
jgi:hypothetical protein